MIPVGELQNVLKKPNWGSFQLYFRETRIVGQFTEADFNTKPGYTFPTVEKGDIPKSFVS